MHDAWVCESINWETDYYGVLALGLTFTYPGRGVGGYFEYSSLDALLAHCQTKNFPIRKPEDLIGKIFQLRWKRRGESEGLCGDTLEAIRLHPAYGEEKPWLRVGIRTTEIEDRTKVKQILEKEEPK